eukprot:m.844791 g.844791  ORF g.844791 m.844791 type:complete len:598 (+) comp23475_c0_seq40:178-1971(+)
MAAMRTRRAAGTKHIQEDDSAQTSGGSSRIPQVIDPGVSNVKTREAHDRTAYGAQRKRFQDTNRLERAITIAEFWYYVLFAIAVPLLLWRYGETLRYDMGLGSSDAVCDRLTTWITNGGGIIDGAKCFFSEEGGGRGIASTTRMPYRHTYASVPLDMCMWEQSLQSRLPELSHVFVTDEVVKKHCGDGWGQHAEPWRLILALHHQMNDLNSFWAPYIATLPPVTSIALWTEEQLDNMQSPGMKESVLAIRESIQDIYDHVVVHLRTTYPDVYTITNTTGVYNYDERTFFSAALHVYARAFDAYAFDKDRPKRHTWVMVPWIDLVNHQSFVGSFFGDSHSNRDEVPVIDGKPYFSSWATECFTADAEMFQSYGSHKSGSHYFQYYGFLPEGSEKNDLVAVSLSQDLGGRLREFKRPPPETPSWYTGVAGIDGHITEAFLFTAVRLAVLEKHYARFEQDHQDTPENLPDRINFTVSTAQILSDSDAWKQVLETILVAVKADVEALPTTLAQDEELLELPFTTYETWATLTLRVRFKRILHTMIENLEYRIAKNATKEEWKFPKCEWSIAYETSTVKARHSGIGGAMSSDSLFETSLMSL